LPGARADCICDGVHWAEASAAELFARARRFTPPPPTSGALSSERIVEACHLDIHELRYRTAGPFVLLHATPAMRLAERLCYLGSAWMIAERGC